MAIKSLSNADRAEVLEAVSWCEVATNSSAASLVIPAAAECGPGGGRCRCWSCANRSPRCQQRLPAAYPPAAWHLSSPDTRGTGRALEAPSALGPHKDCRPAPEALETLQLAWA
mmetsp:Transcript_756/g.1672  ORF Transcript_756/g.1672 Transcript_756/m.1672 type:complete len:114 (+) Transcript_756:49-390(+)